MIAPHDDGAFATDDVEDAEGIRSAGDEIADEDEAVAARELDAVEQGLPLEPASVHVADDDRPQRGQG